MAGVYFPRVFSVCPPAEKLRRLREAYAYGRITLKQLEDGIEAALKEEALSEMKYQDYAADDLSPEAEAEHASHVFKIMADAEITIPAWTPNIGIL